MRIKNTIDKMDNNSNTTALFEKIRERKSKAIKLIH